MTYEKENAHQPVRVVLQDQRAGTQTLVAVHENETVAGFLAKVKENITQNLGPAEACYFRLFHRGAFLREDDRTLLREFCASRAPVMQLVLDKVKLQKPTFVHLFDQIYLVVQE